MNTAQKKILIIDDEAIFREAMVDALTPCGYLCTTEDNPGDGIKRLKTARFDLVLLDIMMNPLDGWDTLDHIRNIPLGQSIPVIMASAKTLQADEIIRYGEQVAGFLKKPFQPADFCEDVSKFFSWYDKVISDANQAEANGVPRSVCDQWIRLSRQIQAIRRLKEIVSPRCIPEGYMTEEECQAKKIREIDRIIDEKILERADIEVQYPSLVG
ncbi:MAG: response regulator [Methanobacteriota archaeon]